MCCKVLRCTSDVKINAKHEFHACFYAWWYGKNSLFCPFFSQIYLISCNIFFSFFSYFSSIFFRKNEKIFFSEKKKKKIFLGMSSCSDMACPVLSPSTTSQRARFPGFPIRQFTVNCGRSKQFNFDTC